MLWTADKTKDVLFWGCVSYAVATVINLLGIAGFWSTFTIIWPVCAGIYVAQASLQVLPAGKAVLVTGCDSGFGHATALHLDKLGFRVFAGCQFAKAGGEGSLRLKREGSERLHVLQIDLTSSEELTQAFEEVKRILPEGEMFWGLVNNAGIARKGAVEWSPMEYYRQAAEVNYFGTIAITKLFLPLIRLSKVPICSPYVGTKFALEGFSDCLRLEMKQFGVKVCVVEPGSHVIATDVLTKEKIQGLRDGCWEKMSDEIRAAYGETNFRQMYAAFVDHGERDHGGERYDGGTFPRARYCSGSRTYQQMLFVGEHLPEWVYDYLYSST
ncbi:D-beta-hydroxybutyrate dehydrogenase-like 6 [Homarus americanus]|uniref:D-beta-hydroxybutyrate dehydrogenase-like 6 n=1 Tax=Homarus americanus TaxID=6706 RepID=A0A8J5JPC5_HOMAM|nr:D-beta-hydroxybutyrate dehydrogenase-like 6 [Homarus americanus]